MGFNWAKDARRRASQNSARDERNRYLGLESRSSAAGRRLEIDADRLLRKGVQARPRQTVVPFRSVLSRQQERAREAVAIATTAEVHCDGSAVPNPGAVGWGVVIVSDVGRVEFCGGARHGTNNSAELSAAISALETLPAACKVAMNSDSNYLVTGMTRWIIAWRRKGFIKNGAPIPNAALWRKLDQLSAGRSITWTWVRGHADCAENIAADRLAQRGRAEAIA